VRPYVESEPVEAEESAAQGPGRRRVQIGAALGQVHARFRAAHQGILDGEYPILPSQSNAVPASDVPAAVARA